jgi:cysteine synthase A
LESINLTGSVKDRMALHILREATLSGALQPQDTIAEATSGNTGIALAAIGRALGHSVRIYMPDWMSAERKAVISSLGAEIIPVSAAEGGFAGSVELAEAFAAGRDDVFLPRQFANEANVRAHEQATGPELLAQLESLDLVPSAFVAGVGTGGTVMGVGRALRSAHPETTVHPMEPANSPTLRTGEKRGKHRIAGISDEFIPPIIDLDFLDEIIDVWDGDAILAAQALARDLGLAVGISSGANLLAAVQLATRGTGENVVATLFPDSNKKYLSTDLVREEPLRADYLTPDLQLLGFEACACPRLAPLGV